MHSMLKLPNLGEAAASHSQKLEKHIKQHLKENHNYLSFAAFMELALYAPGLGYYSAGSQKFGQAGDFVTAAEISPLFSHCLGRYWQQLLVEFQQADILEVGGGSGRMCCDLLKFLEHSKALPQRYFILDLSADLKARQRELLARECPGLLPRVQWIDKFPQSFKGLILANELLDAMPVQCFSWQAAKLMEWGVSLSEGQLQWQLKQPSLSLAQAIDELPASLKEAWHQGYRSEINLNLKPWLGSLSQILHQGVVLLIDYGFNETEYYHPDRQGGTLMCHYRHHAHGDPFFLPGLQDITSHVNFSAVAKAARELDLELLGYTTQADFLLGLGLAEAFSEVQQATCSDFKLSNQINLLTSPAEMGELFKVMALGRGVSLPLPSFLANSGRHMMRL